MNALRSILTIVLLAPSLIAQDAPIPQDLPLPLRQTSDAVRRRVEQVIPPVPLPLPTKRSGSEGFLNRLRGPNRQTLANESRASAGTLEGRIAALEAKVEALQKEVETQKVLIKQLQEVLDQQQQKKN